MLVLPTYTQPPPPDTAGMSVWHWDGEVVRPTLHPSISRTRRRTRSSAVEHIAHGWIHAGEWKPA